MSNGNRLTIFVWPVCFRIVPLFATPRAATGIHKEHPHVRRHRVSTWIFCRHENPKFVLGQIVSTPGALEALDRTREGPFTFIARHVRGDWGDLDHEDRRENERSVDAGDRIFSAYHLKDGTKIWIITEADRSATTILLPEEY